MKVKIEFEVELLNVKHTQAELDEYLRYHFRDNGSVSMKNPFEIAEKIEPKPIFGTFEWSYDNDIDESLVSDWSS